LSYEVLQPGLAPAVGRDRCALAVMAKAPRPGKVKTRLSPPLTPEQASALNICFIRDTTENIQQVTEDSNSTGLVAYTPVGDELAFDGLLPPGFLLLGQRGDGFGERLLHACEDLFASGFSSVCLIDSDSPTMPQRALLQAVERLSLAGDRMLLGASDDGGYYLIGLKRLHQRLFEQIDWSTERVFEQTLEPGKSVCQSNCCPTGTTWTTPAPWSGCARSSLRLLVPDTMRDIRERSLRACDWSNETV
jgi:uncharacterized protein